MKARALAIAMGIGMAGSLSTSAMALTADMEAELLAEIKKIRAETAKLQAKVDSLTGELNTLKKEKAANNKVVIAKEPRAERKVVVVNQAPSGSASAVAKPELEQSSVPSAPIPVAAPGTATTQLPIPVVATTTKDVDANGVPPGERFDQRQNFGLGTTVTTSPYIGLRTEFDASDLVVNLPTMNEDLRLLQESQKMVRASRVEPFRDRPIMELSGKVEGQVFWDDFGGGSHTDVDLSGVELDTLVHVSPWAMGFVSLLYDNSPFSIDSRTVGPRIANSNIFLRRGFLTIGNLDKSPFYFTIGQMYVPFGRYSTSMLSNPMTRVVGRTNERAVVFGYADPNWFAQAYTYRGDTKINTTQNKNINEGGFNLGYTFKVDKVSGQFGVGIISNLSDAMGIQDNGNPRNVDQFSGFGRSFDTEFVFHRVPAVDFHGSLTIGPWAFMAEFLTAVRSYDRRDLSFNGGGATPGALHLETNYNTTVFSKPTSFGVAYDQSWQALAYQIPNYSIAAFVNTSIWKNTIQSLEYRHDFGYGDNTFSCGRIFGPNGPDGDFDHDDFFDHDKFDRDFRHDFDHDKDVDRIHHHKKKRICPKFSGDPIQGSGSGGDSLIFQIGVYW
jgi:hypothetical protein